MTAERSAPNPTNPFVGLRPFRTEESLLFFGRNEQTVELLQQLHRTRFLAVVGSSGCGKSSLIRAGLIPKLKAGFLIEDRDRWLTATMKPGDSPLRNLAAALLEAVFGDTTEAMPEAMVDDFVKAIRQSGAEIITTRLAAKLGDASPTNLLLLIDQFEEIFRFGVESNNATQREEAEDFVSLMLALAEQRTLPIYVVMTMRSDFIGDCDNFYGLPEAMNRSQYLVPRLTRQQRQQAIEGPIRLFGADITPRLLDRVLNDVGDKSDQLPVMQHALMRTFEQWQKERQSDGETGGLGDGANPQSAIRNPQSKNPHSVDVRHYEAVGTLTEALSRDAEAALAALSEENQKIAERMFQALTDTDARNRQIRRPAHLSELSAITGADRDTIETIIEEFSGSGRSFLTATKEADPLIDISHESLIRQWRQMSDWVKAETDWRDRYLRLSHDAEIHQQSGKSEDLLKGTQLTSALEWKDKRNPNPDWARRYFPDLAPQDADQRFDTAVSFLAESRKARDYEHWVIWQQKRKRRAIIVSLTALGFVLAIIFGVMTWKMNSANRQSEENRQKVTQLFYASSVNSAQDVFVGKNRSFGYELLNPFLPDSERSVLREFAWYRLWHLNHQEQATLKGHSNTVLSVAFSPDGKTLASASWDDTIKIWDSQSRQNIATLKGHESVVTSLAFAPDGKTIASGSWDKTIRLWDFQNGHNLAIFKGHENGVESVAFAPDGKTLASASLDKTIKLWDLPSQQLLSTLQGHEYPVRSVVFAPDGKTLASAGNDNLVKIWSTRTRQNIALLKGHERPVLSVAFAPDGKTLASASADQMVKIWDVQTGQNLATLKDHSSAVNSVAFSPDGKMLASASWDLTIKLWDTVSQQGTATFLGHEDGVFSVAFAPDGKTLASASRDTTVKFWNILFRQILEPLKGHENEVDSLVFSPDSKTLASASADKTVKLWDMTAPQNLITLKAHENYVLSVAFSSDGQTLASASDDKTVKLWDTRSGQPINILKGHEGMVWSVTFAPDGKTLASASDDKTVKLWDAHNGQLLNTLRGHEDAVNSVAFAPDGKTIASASGDKKVKLWDAHNGQLLNTLIGHDNRVTSVAFAPDGKTIASASWDNTIKLWDARSGQLLHILKGHEDAVNSVAFAPDGKTIASASWDKTVRLWDTVSRQQLATLKGHEDSVYSVVFAPDGKTLASAGGAKKDFSIRLWRAATDADVARQRNK